MRVFLVGITGFLGWHAARELSARGHAVCGAALPPMPADGLFPPGTEIRLGDVHAMSDGEVRSLLAGSDALVYAAGADDRTTPPAPAYPFFRKANVECCSRIVCLAREAGVCAAVVLGSYFAHFARIWPAMALARRHPYIRSRLEQEEAVVAAGGGSMRVMTLELPYIFGTMPGRTPMWTILLDRLDAWKTVYFPRGGTAMVTARQVGQAIAGAVEKGEGGKRYPVGGRNMPWTEFLGKLLFHMGQDKRIVTIPTFLAKLYGITERRKYRRDGRESGLEPVSFMDLQSRETYIDPRPSMEALGYGEDDLEAALQETVAACRRK